MSFPDKTYSTVSEFALEYFAQYVKCSEHFPHENLSLAVESLISTYASGNMVYVCGNGGSAAISNHLVCDHLKGIKATTAVSPRVTSLSSNIEIITAIANDIDYNDIFVFQLESLAQRGDLLITISASGDSENIVRALDWASANGLASISMTGFDGGRSAKLADVNLHVGGDNYGVIEDVHQSIMHILAQYVRLISMDKGKIVESRF